MVNSKYSGRNQEQEALSLMCSSGRKKVTGTREQRESGGKREMLLQRLAEFKSHRASEAM